MTHPSTPPRRPARTGRSALVAAVLVLAVAAVPVAFAVAREDQAPADPVPGALPEPSPASSSGPSDGSGTGPETDTAEATEPPAPTLRLPRFAPASDQTWLRTIPPGLPLDHALPPSESEDVGSVSDLAFCDVAALRPAATVDHRTAGAAGPEYGELRDLRIFDDDRAAHRYVDGFVEAVTSCPRQQVRGGTTWRHDLLPTGLVGDEGVTAVQTFEQDGMLMLGANWWEVVRIGNAVLVTATGGEWMPGPRLEAGIRQHARDVEPVVAAMCAFSPTGCGPDIPQDFPLAAGWPDEDLVEPGGDHGLRGPGRGLPPLALRACDRELAATDHVDRLTATWANVEDYRDRELTTYQDAAAATARVADIRAFLEACPRHPGGDGYVAVTEVLRTGVGGESWAVVVRQERAGAPAVGLQVIHVIRFGRGVLVDSAASEAGAGPDPRADVRRQVREQTRGTAEVVAAMCAFSEAGCDG